VLAVVKTLGRDKAMISGESLGGWVATYFAAYRPAAVEKLVLNTAAGAAPTNVARRSVRRIALSPGAIGCRWDKLGHSTQEPPEGGMMANHNGANRPEMDVENPKPRLGPAAARLGSEKGGDATTRWTLPRTRISCTVSFYPP
jgi:pimeloyl-ACP methyl ester carboxylesterase